MKHLPWLSASANSRHSVLLSPWIALLSGVLFCTCPALTAQSLTFAEAQSTAVTGVGASQVATDSAGNLFFTEYYTGVFESPRTATGYGAQILLPTDLNYAVSGVALDGAGDVFVSDYYFGLVVELPRTATGYGPQTTLFTGPGYGPYMIAADNAGDVFMADYNVGGVALASTCTAAI